MKTSNNEVREIMEKKRKKLTMCRVRYLRYVKRKNLSMSELHFLMAPTKTVIKREVSYTKNHACPYDSKENIALNRLARLDKEILIYQLINEGYNKESAKIIATNIIKNQFDNYLYRSIDLHDYVINQDLTVVLKDAEKVIENLDNQINFKEMANENNKR